MKLAFNGHAHIYQRNFADPGGTVAYLTGGGGAKTQSVAEDPCLAIDAYAIGWSNSSSTGNACGAATPPSSPAEVIHFLKVTVDGSQVTVEPINSLGQSFDVQTYDVGGPPPDTEAPSVPTGVSAVAASSSLVNVSWTASTDNVGVTGYDVLRDDAVIASVSGTTLTYADATVAASTTYSYQVVAKDLAGNHSAPSIASSVTTPAPPDTEAPSVPTGVSAVAASSSLVNVSWSASTDNVGVTGYDVLRDDAVIASVSGTTLTYADATVAASTTYSYRWWPRISPATTPLRASRPASPRRPRAARPRSASWLPRTATPTRRPPRPTSGPPPTSSPTRRPPSAATSGSSPAASAARSRAPSSGCG